MIIRSNLKEVRQDHDITQQEVAAILGVAQNTYSQYENGKREIPISKIELTAPVLIQLADYYQVSIDYLLGHTGTGRTGNSNMTIMDTRMRELREDRDLSQAQVAKILNCDQSLYSKYERGQRELPLRFALLLADYYHVSLDYLMCRTTKKEIAL